MTDQQIKKKKIKQKQQTFPRMRRSPKKAFLLVSPLSDDKLKKTKQQLKSLEVKSGFILTCVVPLHVVFKRVRF